MGYKLSSLAFSNGQPVDPPSSTTAAKDILSNSDLSACPGKCFRPVGLAMDGKGRVYVSSDSTGEIYVLQKADMTALGGGSATGSGTFVTSTAGGLSNVGARSGRNRLGDHGVWMACAAVALSLVGGAMLVAA